MLVKYFNKFILILLCTVSLLSCEKFSEFGDTNVNPNGVTDPNTAFLLTNVEAGLAGATLDYNAGYYCQYFSDPIYGDAALYTFQTYGLGDYSASLMDLQNIINYNTDPISSGTPSVISNGANENQIAICRILKCFVYWRITDALGDIPYGQALKGQNGSFTPAYDRQENIYKDILKELREAVDQFDNTSSPAMKGDIIYNGDRGKWKRFANSLRLLIAIRLSKKYPGPGDYPAVEASSANEHPAGFIVENADNFTVSYPGSSFPNPLSVQNQSGVSKTFTDLLEGMNDNRRNAFGAESFFDAGSNVPSSLGVPFGLDKTDGPQFTGANPTWARIMLGVHRQSNSPFVIIGAANVLLACAEAKELGWIAANTANPGSASENYEAGVKLSFEQWNVLYTSPTPANFDYSSGTGVAQIGINSYNSIPDSSNAITASKLDRIHLQQYIAWYPKGFFGWAEWRRTDMPNLAPTRFNRNANKGIPRRYAYSQTQYNTNRSNVLEAAGRLPLGDVQETRVWWDQ